MPANTTLRLPRSVRPWAGIDKLEVRWGYPNDSDDMAFALMAVNSHTALVAALREALDVMDKAYEGERCDHDANICICGVRATQEQARVALRLAGEEV